MAQKQKKSSFDIKSMLNPATLEQQTQKRKKINYKQLVAHEKNHYSLEGIEELADSIEDVGLLHDVLVKESGEVNEAGEKLYTIVSGHRRVFAMTLLVEDRKLKKYADIPCVLMDANEDEDITEMKLHYANMTTREMSEYDKMMAVSEMKRLIQQAKANGVPIKGRIKENVAQAVGLGATQTQKYLTVAENSTEEVKEAIKSGELTIEEASRLIQENKAKETEEKEKPEEVEDKPKLDIEQVRNKQEETTREKLYKKLLGLEKAFDKNANEFEDYKEIKSLFKQIERHFE